MTFESDRRNYASLMRIRATGEPGDGDYREPGPSGERRRLGDRAAQKTLTENASSQDPWSNCENEPTKWQSLPFRRWSFVTGPRCQDCAALSCRACPIIERRIWPTLCWRSLDNSMRSWAHCDGRSKLISTTPSAPWLPALVANVLLAGAASGLEATIDIKNLGQIGPIRAFVAEQHDMANRAPVV